MNDKQNTYTFGERWKITGTFTTRTPLHIGSGGTTTRKELVNEPSKECEVQAVVLDCNVRPCIPGTAIKGVLRSWATTFVDNAAIINKLFGDENVNSDEAKGGRTEFLTAFITDPSASIPHVPYWCKDRVTGVLSHVCIDRATGAAEAEKLFFEEYVPAGVSFKVEIVASGVSEADVGFLLAILEQGANHSTHPYQFGANGADGWGRVEWTNAKVGCIKQSAISLASLRAPIPFTLQSTQSATLKLKEIPHVAMEWTLAFEGPFLVNDASAAKPKGAPEGDMRTNFTPLRSPDGSVWLPASSFRGALRQRAEFILRTLDASAIGPIERVFGATSHASRLTIEEFHQTNPYLERKQDFVAIDRFTGGAADGAKFDATYADRPTLKSKLTLNLEGLEQADIGLLALALRDIVKGQVAVGFGGAKGYGWTTGKLRKMSAIGVEPEWHVPTSLLGGTIDDSGIRWLNKCLASIASIDTSAKTDAIQPTVSIAITNQPIEKLTPGKLTIIESTKKPGNYDCTLHYQDGNKTKKSRVKYAEVSENLHGQKASDIDVEFVHEKGEFLRIRRKGEECVLLPVTPAPPQAQATKFFHPYYFLPLQERGAVKDDPAPHCHLVKVAFSGTIRVRLTTKTPLLICDDEELVSVDANGHKTYKMRMDKGKPLKEKPLKEKPLLASSSIRGMLRSAYEAITNSRFGVFPGKLAMGKAAAEKHGIPLSFRPPGNVGRRMYNRSPLQCLPESLRPASSLAELSPADRVFGWVSQNSETEAAYRGNISVGPVECTSPDPIHPFSPRISLAILGQPKPAQGRFYLGTSDGAAQRPRIDKETAGYTGGNRIRGPKVYPHHMTFLKDPTDPNAEWVRRPDRNGIFRDNQNRSISGWVKPDTTFEFDLHVKNLSRLELGALVWLLEMPPDHFLRLGLGKPLGFGSVKAEIDSSLIADGGQWASYYSQWDSTDPSPADLKNAKAAFDAAMKQANPKLLEAFLKSAAGFAGPIHYPRLQNQNPGSGEHFKWFGANESGGKLPLPDLTTPDCSLPRNPTG